MFKQARLKLTAWYLLIIMAVSLAFSGVIYTAASHELQRFAEAQRMRFERRTFELDLPRDFGINPIVIVDTELLVEAKRRILLSLLIIDLGILGISGVLGYYLSGKTLAPIQEMVNEQDRFVSDASHELKTPITAIKTTLEVALRDKKLSLKEAHKTLIISLDEVEQLQKLAEGLLELTHKRVDDQVSPTNLLQIVEGVVQTIEPLAKKKKVEISVNIPRERVILDQSSMTRALLAVIDNAIKYSPEKSQVEIVGKMKGRRINLTVKDHGKGIDAKDLSMVFDRFYRADQSRSTNGYGLGLAIAKQIVEEHAGTIAITSKLGVGTSVTINLPSSARLQER